MQEEKGKTTGWIGYTLAWSYRQFDEINDGQRYSLPTTEDTIFLQSLRTRLQKILNSAELGFMEQAVQSLFLNMNMFLPYLVV